MAVFAGHYSAEVSLSYFPQWLNRKNPVLWDNGRCDSLGCKLHISPLSAINIGQFAFLAFYVRNECGFLWFPTVPLTAQLFHGTYILQSTSRKVS